MSTQLSQCLAQCRQGLRRRDFLAVAGASAWTFRQGGFAFAGPSLNDQTRIPGKAHVRAVFVRPEREQYHMSWPGASYDPQSRQLEYIKTLSDAAQKLGVQLDVNPVPLHDPDSVSQMLEELKQRPGDGVIMTVMHLQSWPQAEYLIKERGHLPLVVFSPLGTSLTERLQASRQVPQTFLAATPDHSFLAAGLRMLRTVFDFAHARLCVVTDAAQGERRLDKIGVTLRYVPLARWVEEFQRADLNDEMREMAKYYAIESQGITEPEATDLLNAARSYAVARRLMTAEKCQGISLDCGPLVGEHQVPCGPCLAWSRLLDEGRVGGCEGDTDAAISLMLAVRLLDRPGFMQDPAPNTVNNTLIGAHCTCATKLDGYDRPHVGFTLRNHAESTSGVSLRVMWQPSEEMTIMKFLEPASLLLGTGRVVRNIDTSSSGGCRTAVEVRVDDVADVRDIKGHHQIFVPGKFDHLLRAYGELAGWKVLHI